LGDPTDKALIKAIYDFDMNMSDLKNKYKIIKKGGKLMVVYVVKVFVEEGHIEDFKKATRKNHRNTLQEPGNIRFDVLQSKEDPSRFTLYEVYESEDAVNAHKETPHYLEWRDTVADWMAKSREGLKHKVIAPEDKELW